MLLRQVGTFSPQSGETVILAPEGDQQEENSNSECAPASTSPDSCPSMHTVTNTLYNPIDKVNGTVSALEAIPPFASLSDDTGALTRGIRGRKTSVCSKIPPEFQPPREMSTLIPAKKAVWIVHPDHREVVVAAGRTGPGPKSKAVKDGPQCPPGVQWIHVLHIFKPSTGVLYPSPSDDRLHLECALPPKRGKHALLMWNSHYLVPYKVNESTCTSS